MTRGEHPGPVGAVATVHPGGPRGVRREGSGEVDRLLRQERLAARRPVLAVRRAGHGRVDRGERVGGRHRPVAAHHQPRPRPVQVAERVLPGGPLRAEERDRQLGHLLLVAGPQRLGVGRDAELGEARDVVGVDELEVGDVVAQVVTVPGGPGGREGVERLPDAAVADRVHVHLEALGRQRDHDLLELLGVDERVAGVVGGVAAPVEVRRPEGGRAVLEHAVLHDLHARRPEAWAGQGLAAAHEIGDLGDPEAAVPPERADHVGDEVALLDRAQIGRAGVVHAGVRADDRVLPGRDAEREQVGLTRDEPVVVVLLGRGRQQPGDQAHRTLVEGAGRRAVGEPLDPAVGRVRGLGGDPGELEGAGVDPGAVVVAVGQERGAVGHDGVEVGRRRGAAREGRHRPAAAEHPRPVVTGGVRRDRGEEVVARAALREVAPQHLEAALDRVAVGVGEAGRDEAAGQVDHLDQPLLGPDAAPGGADAADDAVLDQEVVPRQVPAPVEDRASGEQRGHQRPSRSGPAGSCVIPTFAAASPERASRHTRFARYAVISAWS